MADDQIYRTTFQFDASTAKDAKTIIASVQNALQDLAETAPAAEKAATQAQRALQNLGTTAARSGQQARGAIASYRALGQAVGSANTQIANGKSSAGFQGILGKIPNTSALTSTVSLQLQKTKELSAAQNAAYAEDARRTAGIVKAEAEKQRAFASTARAAKQAADSTKQLGNFYPLLVSAGIFGAIATAAKDAGAAVVTVGTEYETAFAQVARTTSVSGGNATAQIQKIRDGLRDLATQIPVSFQNLSGIATLGNQLGISGQNILSFTKTVAQFSAVTGVTTDETARSFGSLAEILHLSASEYADLGSAITYVGRNSVATEAELLTMSQRIGSTAEQAGFSTQQIIGLSGALSSLREAPERSQGALEKYFKVINSASAEGGKKLQGFSAIIGETNAETQKLIEKDPYTFFRKFLAGLNSLSSSKKTNTLTDLGLGDVRVSEVLRRLAGNLKLVDSTQADANVSFKQGTDLSSQYSVIAATLASKFQELTNAASNLLDTLANSGALSGLANVVDFLTKAVGAIDQFAQKNQTLVQAFIAIGAAVGILSAVRTAYFLAAIAASALEGASARVGGAGLIGNLKTMASVLFGLRGAGYAAAEGEVVAAGASETLRVAIAGLFRATIVLGVISAITELVLNFGGSMQFASSVLNNFQGFLNTTIIGFFTFAQGVTNAMQTAVQGVALGANAISGILGPLASFAAGVLGTISQIQGAAIKDQKSVSTNSGFLKDFSSFAGGLQDSNKITTPDYSKLTAGSAGAAKQSAALAKSLANVGSAAPSAASGLGNVGDAADKSAKQVRTLTDYASDLSSTFQRASDIRFAPKLANDGITSQFQEMQKGAKDAAKAIQDAKDKVSSLKAEIAKLQADNGQQKYFLSIAQQFGDSLRAGAIQATIDTNNADIGSKKTDLKGAQGDVSTAQDSATKSLKGNTGGAIANRKAITDLVSKYQDYITKLAASGASQDTIKKKIAESKDRFYDQAKALGYSKSQLKPYAASFDDFLTIVNKIPKSVTVRADTNPAKQALDEYKAKAASTASSVAKSFGGLKGLKVPGISIPTMNTLGARQRALTSLLARYLAEEKKRVANGNFSDALDSRISQIQRQLKSGDYYNGGYTGRGGKYQIAGTVHRGEYVIPKHLVNQNTGLPNADALGRLVKGSQGRQGYAAGGFVSGGMQVMELGPKSLQAVRALAHQEAVAVIASSQITNAVDSQNRMNRRRGGG